MRILALSDLHVDHAENRAWVEDLSRQDYTRDVLIVAGDVTHRMDLFAASLEGLRPKFAEIFFVPGNHEPWLVGGAWPDSMAKLHAVLVLCETLGVSTRPARPDTSDGGPWIVPLHAWYVEPEQGPDSLYLDKRNEAPVFRGWADHRFVRWPRFPDGQNAADYFLSWNLPHLDHTGSSPVISFSHFLPRSDLIPPVHPEERVGDSRPAFNFSRVAGTRALERQIRALGPRVHVYGHQHRNRRREIDGVLYVSHCLGYGHERRRGEVSPEGGPLCVWEDGVPLPGRS